MSKLKKICDSLFKRKNTDSGRYKAIIEESYQLRNDNLRVCVVAKNQDDIIPNVKRRMKNHYADKVEIVNVFYQAAKGDFFVPALLSNRTKQAIETFNKMGDEQDVPGNFDPK